MNDLDQAKASFLEGLRLIAANSFQAAEAQFERSLKLVPDRVSTLNNLSAVKLRLRKFAEAEDLARKAVALEDQSPAAWSNLGSVLAATQRHDEALQAYDRALDGNAAGDRVWLSKARSLLALKHYDDALIACDEAQKLNPGPEVLYVRSLALKGLDRPAEAKQDYLTSIQMRTAAMPVFVAERRPTQQAEILVVNFYPRFDASLRPFELLHLHCDNFPGQLARLFREDFLFTFVFDGDAIRPGNRERIPPPDIVLNNCANGEHLLATGRLPVLVEWLDRLGVPVVNHPAKAVQTTRDASVKLLEGVPGLSIPKTERFSSAGKSPADLVREIEARFDYPLITRTVFAQEGKGMNKVDSRDALVAVLASGLPEKFLVTQFIDSRAGNEFYRKIRAAVVQDDLLITRVDYSANWNVRGRKSEKRVPFYLENRHLLDEEKKICQDPAGRLGRFAVETLRAIRNRIPLEVFGIDFDVDGDGAVVFYEANASMNLFSTAHRQVPNPREPEEDLKLAFRRYFLSLIARR